MSAASLIPILIAGPLADKVSAPVVLSIVATAVIATGIASARFFGPTEPAPIPPGPPSQPGGGGAARPSTTATFGSASRIDGGRDHLPVPAAATEDDPRPVHHCCVDPDRQIGRKAERRHAADLHAGQSRVSSAAANDALREPSRLRTVRLTSSRCGASTTHAA